MFWGRFYFVCNQGTHIVQQGPSSSHGQTSPDPGVSGTTTCGACGMYVENGEE